MINIRKRGSAYQYQFEAEPIDGKRKQITKSGFKTKNEAYLAGMRAYNNYINGDVKEESQMKYGKYWDYYEYVENNPITNWNIKTSILYGNKDNLQDESIIKDFCNNYNCEL